MQLPCSELGLGVGGYNVMSGCLFTLGLARLWVPVAAGKCTSCFYFTFPSSSSDLVSLWQGSLSQIMTLLPA